ncbi:MAG: hypothetical protein WKF66_16675 [Pedobacter sp.]
MYRILISLIIVFACDVQAQEKLNTFHVVDSISKKPIRSASVTLMRAKLSMSTESDGIFIIPGNLKLLNDSVIIYSQGYGVFRTLLNRMDGMDSIKLAKQQFKLDTTDLTGKQESILNPFKVKDVVRFTGINTATTPFEYLQLAQQFYLIKPGAQLTKVRIRRLAFSNIDYSNTLSYKGIDYAKFRLRFYAADSLQPGPGREICTEIVEVSDRDNQQISVDVEKYHIMVPGKSFFIAVEWIKDFVNQGFSNVFDRKTYSVKQSVNFRPAIGILDKRGNQLNIWSLNLKRQWKPFTYYAPYFTDLALTAIVKQE